MPRKTRPSRWREPWTARASMRPRPDAAENVQMWRCRTTSGQRFNEAAARCRGKRVTATHSAAGPACFNEAAARCRGKRNPHGRIRGPVAASMRPRPDAAENRPLRPGTVVGGRGFNEAAARCRGKPDSGFRRGSRTRASMRPRPDAAENSEGPAGLDGRRGASMRPRPDAAENRSASDRVMRGFAMLQ